MNNYKLFFFTIVLMSSTSLCQTLKGPSHGKAVVCYVASWAAYRPEGGKFELDNLNPQLCTHLVYSFAGLDDSNSAIKSLDPWQDLEKDYGKNGYKRMVALKEKYPHLKVTIAIGGWNEGSLKYSLMAESADKRSKFIKSVVLFLEMYKFDGLDLDWEYPNRRDGRPQDKVNFVTLIKELKEAFEPHGYILTAALGAGKSTMEAAYELSKISRYLDLIHMMCYDYHGTWDGVVGANAPLSGTSEEDELNVEFTIKYMLEHGVSPYKMVLGLPMYGRNFIIKSDAEEVVFGKTPAESIGFKGPFTKEAGFMGYNEICMELQDPLTNWTRHWDESSATPYLRDGKRVISYDDPRSIALKVKMAMQYNLGGVMVWSIDTDDFKGVSAFEDNDAFIDFEERYREISGDPVLKHALKNVNLHHGTAYIVDNGNLKLRLPDNSHKNYILMNTINSAVRLAIEEKMILDEMDKVSKENEIDVSEKKVVRGAASTSRSIASVIFGLLVLTRV